MQDEAICLIYKQNEMKKDWILIKNQEKLEKEVRM